MSLGRASVPGVDSNFQTTGVKDGRAASRASTATMVAVTAAWVANGADRTNLKGRAHAMTAMAGTAVLRAATNATPVASLTEIMRCLPISPCRSPKTRARRAPRARTLEAEPVRARRAQRAPSLDRDKVCARRAPRAPTLEQLEPFRARRALRARTLEAEKVRARRAPRARTRRRSPALALRVPRERTRQQAKPTSV